MMRGCKGNRDGWFDVAGCRAAARAAVRAGGRGVRPVRGRLAGGAAPQIEDYLAETDETDRAAFLRSW